MLSCFADHVTILFTLMRIAKIVRSLEADSNIMEMMTGVRTTGYFLATTACVSSCLLDGQLVGRYSLAFSQVFWQPVVSPANKESGGGGPRQSPARKSHCCCMYWKAC